MVGPFPSQVAVTSPGTHPQGVGSRVRLPDVRLYVLVQLQISAIS